MFFIDDDDTLESMWILADQTFLTCSKGRELGPVRDLAIRMVEPDDFFAAQPLLEPKLIKSIDGYIFNNLTENKDEEILLNLSRRQKRSHQLQHNYIFSFYTARLPDDTQKRCATS